MKIIMKHSSFVMQSGAMKLNVNKLLMDSPEVKLNEFFVSNIFNGDGLTPSDISTDIKNTTRGVSKFWYGMFGISGYIQGW